MKTKLVFTLAVLGSLALGVSLSAGDRARGLSQSAQADEARARLERLAAALKLDLGRITNSGAERNMVGIKSDNVLFSQRRDSRTYFAQDNRYGLDKPAGVFRGPDDTALERARAILRTLEIPGEEISKAEVLREKNQTARVDPRTRRLILEEPGEGKVFAEFSRQVGGVPVFSSRALIGLNREAGVGYMEVHWPVIPKAVVEEARRLQELVKGRWQPPAQKGARVESVEAGIIHSPAMGFVMDIYPAIRVIYSPLDGRTGRKLTLYLDAQARPVPTPRQFERLEETPEQARPYRK